LSVPRLSPTLLAMVLLGHAGVLLAMVTMRQLDEPAVLPRALTVSLIEMPEAVKKPEPRPQPPRPVVKPQPKPPVLAVAQPKIAPAEQTPVVVEPPKPVAEPAPAAPAVAAEASRPAPPAPLVEPRLDANYLDNPKPPYPFMSKRLGEQGVVQLRVFVNADGSVGKLELKRSSGHPRLDQSAMSTVQNWRFVPARQGSQTIAAWVVVPVHFTLGS
jgi:protein TonB